MSTATGTFFDGQSLRGQAVALEFTADRRLVVTGDGVAHDVGFDAVRFSDRLGDVPRFVYLPGDAIIETPDNAAIDEVLAAEGRSRAAGLIHFLETQRIVATVGCFVVVAVLAAVLRFGPPHLARIVADRVPTSIDAQAGQIALATLDPYFGPSALTPAEKERVERQLQRLLAGAPPAPRPRLEFRSMHSGLPNAFALPGNTILVTDQLVRLPARDDELAAVLAHELGHLEKRHGIQSMLRGSFTLLIVSAITGDLSTLTSFAASVPLTILTKGYARDLEREADRHAHDLLRARGITLEHFSTLLVKLEAALPKGMRHSNYMSTHPSNEERIATFGGLSPEARTAALADGESSPVPLTQTRPHYSFLARRKKLEGEVVVGFTIDIHGRVQNASVVRSAHPELEPAALSAVRQWTFLPQRKGFQPVAANMQVPIVFQLDEQPEPPHPAPRE